MSGLGQIVRAAVATAVLATLLVLLSALPAQADPKPSPAPVLSILTGGVGAHPVQTIVGTVRGVLGIPAPDPGGATTRASTPPASPTHQPPARRHPTTTTTATAPASAPAQAHQPPPGHRSSNHHRRTPTTGSHHSPRVTHQGATRHRPIHRSSGLGGHARRTGGGTPVPGRSAVRILAGGSVLHRDASATVSALADPLPDGRTLLGLAGLTAAVAVLVAWLVFAAGRRPRTVPAGRSGRTG